MNLPEPIQSIYESRFFLVLFSIFATQVYNYIFKPPVDKLVANFVPFTQRRLLLGQKQDYLAVCEYKQGTRNVSLDSARIVSQMVTSFFGFWLGTALVIAEGTRLNGKVLTIREMLFLLAITLFAVNCMAAFIRNKRSLDARCHIFSNFEHFEKKFTEVDITLNE